VNEILRTKLKSKPKEAPLLYLIKWPTSFFVILMTFNWAVASWSFYTGSAVTINSNNSAAFEYRNGDEASGRWNVHVDGVRWQATLLAFNLIGMLVCPAILLYAGWKLMKDVGFNDRGILNALVKLNTEAVDDATKDLAAILDDKGNAGNIVDKLATLSKENLVGNQESQMAQNQKQLNKAHEELQKSKKALEETSAQPTYVTAAFAFILMFRAIPQLVLLCIYMFRASKGSNDRTVQMAYLLFAIVVDILVSSRVVASAAYKYHPTFLLILIVNFVSVLTTWLAYGLAVAPYGPNAARTILLVANILSTAAFSPAVSYIAYRLLKDLPVSQKKDGKINDEDERALLGYDEEGDDGDLYLDPDTLFTVERRQDEDELNLDSVEIALLSELKEAEELETTFVDVHIEEAKEKGRSPFQGMLNLAEGNMAAMAFGASFFLKSAPTLVAFGMYFHATESDSSTLAGFVWALVVCGLELTALQRWAYKQSPVVWYTMVMHINGLLGMWLFLGLRGAAKGAPKIITILTTLLAVLVTVVLAPVHFHAVWKDTRPNELNYVGDQMKFFGERISNKIVGSFAGFDLLVYGPVVVLQLASLYDNNSRSGGDAAILVVVAVAGVMSAYPALLWLWKRHPMIFAIALSQFVLTAVVWLAFGFAIGPSGHPTLAKVAAGVNVVATLVAVVLTKFVFNQLLEVQRRSDSTVTSGAKVFADNEDLEFDGFGEGDDDPEIYMEIYDDPETNPNLSSAARRRARLAKRKLEHDQTKASRNLFFPVTALVKKVAGSFAEQAGSLLLDERSGVDGGGKRVFIAIAIDLTFKTLGQLTVCAYALSSGGLTGAEAFAIKLAVSLLAVYGTAELLLVSWWCFRAHTYFLAYTAVETMCWVANLMLITSGTVAGSIGATIGVNVVATFIYASQLTIAYYHLTDQLMLGILVDTKWNAWDGIPLNTAFIGRKNPTGGGYAAGSPAHRMKRIFNLDADEGLPTPLTVFLGLLPLLVRHVPVLIVVAMALGKEVKGDKVNSEDDIELDARVTISNSLDAASTFSLICTCVSAMFALVVILKRCYEGCRRACNSSSSADRRSQSSNASRRGGGSASRTGSGPTSVDRRAGGRVAGRANNRRGGRPVTTGTFTANMSTNATATAATPQLNTPRFTVQPAPQRSSPELGSGTAAPPPLPAKREEEFGGFGEGAPANQVEERFGGFDEVASALVTDVNVNSGANDGFSFNATALSGVEDDDEIYAGFETPTAEPAAPPPGIPSRKCTYTKPCGFMQSPTPGPYCKAHSCSGCGSTKRSSEGRCSKCLSQSVAKPSDYLDVASTPDSNLEL
jgi:hypothetical protein